MKRFLLTSFILLSPGLVMAQSPFDGTWIAKPGDAQLPQHPEVYSLHDGMYECENCMPKIKAKADGKDYPLAGTPYCNTIAVRVVDDHTVQITEKMKDKVVYEELDKVSDDGNTLHQDVTDSAAPNGEPVKAEETFRRVGASAGATGIHAISGSWQVEKIKFNSDNGATVTYHSTANGMQASNPGGEGYDAKFDGKEYPVQGDPTHSTVSLRKIDDHTIVETDRQDGNVHYFLRMTVSPDGKTMRVTETDTERGTKLSYTLEKKKSS
jgi:hypothetical protein